jgi:hypothetical protein
MNNKIKYTIYNYPEDSFDLNDLNSDLDKFRSEITAFYVQSDETANIIIVRNLFSNRDYLTFNLNDNRIITNSNYIPLSEKLENITRTEVFKARLKKWQSENKYIIVLGNMVPKTAKLLFNDNIFNIPKFCYTRIKHSYDYFENYPSCQISKNINFIKTEDNEEFYVSSNLKNFCLFLTEEFVNNTDTAFYNEIIAKVGGDDKLDVFECFANEDNEGLFEQLTNYYYEESSLKGLLNIEIPLVVYNTDINILFSLVNIFDKQSKCNNTINYIKNTILNHGD